MRKETCSTNGSCCDSNIEVNYGNKRSSEMVQYFELIYLVCTKALLLGLYSPPQVMERADTAGLHSEPASTFLSLSVCINLLSKEKQEKRRRSCFTSRCPLAPQFNWETNCQRIRRFAVLHLEGSSMLKWKWLSEEIIMHRHFFKCFSLLRWKHL